MKKVLYVTTISGFLPQFEMSHVQILKDMGCEIHYGSNFHNPIYNYEDDVLEKAEIIPHQIDLAKSPFKLWTNCLAIKQLRELIDKEEIDMVHCHTPVGGMAARVAGQLSKKKPYMIYTAHGFHFYKGAPLLNWLLFYPIEKILARWTDVIITINREDYARAKRKFKLRNKEGVVTQIHGVGLNANRFRPNSSIREEKRKEINIPEESYHIVTAAELRTNKNQGVVLEALAELTKEGMDDIYYTLCGKGPEMEELKRHVEKLDLSKRVSFLGFRMDMEEILQTADLFAFPSKREGLGMAALEALSCGVPVVATDNRGTREYIRQNMNGISCTSNDVNGFSKAIKEIRSWNDDGVAERCRNSIAPFRIEETDKEMMGIYKVAFKYF